MEKSPQLRTSYLTKEDFEEALAEYSSREWFVYWIFILSFTSTILNGFHVMSYVFYSVTPKHWCSIPVLEEANWTPKQIRAVSSPRWLIIRTNANRIELDICLVLIHNRERERDGGDEEEERDGQSNTRNDVFIKLDKLHRDGNVVVSITMPSPVLFYSYHRCTPDELSNCKYYDWNYIELRDMGYESALEKVKADRKPKTIVCKRYSYEIKYKDSSFVPEVRYQNKIKIRLKWDMVCNRLAMKATVQTAVSFGKFFGAFAFGVLADRYGRKITFTISCLIYMISGPVVAWTHSYLIMVMCRVGLGVAGIGVYQGAYSILIEISPPHRRSTFGVMFNMSYPVGMILIAIIAYYIREWRVLQLYISMPSFILILHMLAMPESPRWLYYSNHMSEAWKMMRSVVSPEKQKMIDELQIDFKTHVKEKTIRFEQFKQNFHHFKHAEMTVRLILCWFIWFSTSMGYYVLSITSAHLKIDSYLYTGLSGIAEGISYVIVIPMLQILGRRNTSFILFLCSAFSFSILLFIPEIMTNTKMFIALFGRLCISSVFVAVIVHLSELFPTVIRNIAIGSSSTFAHIGSTIAPYLVDYFVIYGWWVPNSVCGITTFISAMLTQVFPETKNLDLYNTMDDFFARCKVNSREQLSFKNSIIYTLLTKLNIVKRSTPMITAQEK
ncbi:solute carrier family 22 member 6-like [Vespula squamosa]|uniref:Solute carrier family 22 member 6-like n=1 Tax=Vespula squamosa TaxID=30214 RepID=A0ABD2C5K0_VESSQ